MKFLLVLFLLIPLVTGVSYSPDSLTYLSEPGEELCQVVILEDEGAAFAPEQEKVGLFDLWAPDFNVNRDINYYDVSSDEHSLTLKYPEEVSSDMAEIEICIIGSVVGKYRGALVFNETLESVWLDVIIDEPERNSDALGSSPGNSGGGGGSKNNKLSFIDEDDNIKDDVDDFDIEAKFELTGELIEKDDMDFDDLGDIDFDSLSDEEKYKILFGDIEDKTITFWNYVPIIFIVLLIVAKVYVAKKKRKNEE